MAGVSRPSPITIQVPRRTSISKAVCKLLCLSSNILILELFLFSGGRSSLYIERASSEACLFGRKLTLTWRHINEYRAKVPPAKNERTVQNIIPLGLGNDTRPCFPLWHLPSPLSSARRTMKTYLKRGSKVRVQNTKERTPKISSLVSECWMSSAKVLLYT